MGVGVSVCIVESVQVAELLELLLLLLLLSSGLLC